MRIAIDTFGTNHAKSGIGTYIFYFLSNLQNVLRDEKYSHIEVELFGSEIDKFTYTSGKDIKYTSVDVKNTLSAERLWHFTSSQGFFEKQGYDALIFPAIDKVLPLSFKIPSIAILNTVLSFKVEGRSDLIQKMQIKRGLYKINRIIVPSDFIKQDLVHSGVDSEKIEIIYGGVDKKSFFPVLKLEDVTVDIKPFAVKRPYFLYASSLSNAEKHHIELIKAFNIFKKKTSLPHRLVLAGIDGPFSPFVHKEAISSPFGSDIFITGFFSHENFAALLSRADSTIFPSSREGVGFPVLESLASGIPVACSNEGALGEMAGDAAVYFNSSVPEEIAKGMERVTLDVALRTELVKKGLERAKAFDWEKTLKKTFDVIRKL